MADAYIVECAICQQPWEVGEPLVSVPLLRAIQVPAHPIIERSDSSPTHIECPGPQLPGLGFGARDRWEREWISRYPMRPIPAVLDGAAIELSTRPRFVLGPRSWRRTAE